MMHTTDREAAQHLMGYCETCDKWHPFEAVDKSKGCPIHGTRWSAQHGLQITTQRTWSQGKAKKLTKKDSVA